MGSEGFVIEMNFNFVTLPRPKVVHLPTGNFLSRLVRPTLRLRFTLGVFWLALGL